jgi:nucleotide-binding universal stress UspA family protein
MAINPLDFMRRHEGRDTAEALPQSPPDSPVALAHAPEAVETLVVPVDGSRLSRSAAAVAGPLACRLDAELHLLSAVPTADEADGRLSELATIDVPCGRVGRSVAVDPDPAGVIHEAVDRRPGAVACMATHGRGRSAALVGSVATRVVARSRHPVLLVCPLVDRRPAGDGVLACVDDGPDAALVVSWALTWAELLGEAVTVVTVAERAGGPIGATPTRRRFGPEGDVDAFLHAVVQPARHEGHRLETLALYDPISPPCGLYGYLREHPATLVVAGARAPTGLAHLVFGSVAGSLVRHSPSPVLILPASGTP